MATQQRILVQDAGSLYTYTPSTNQFSKIGSTGTLLTDIAALSDSSVFGVGFTSLYSVDASSGKASFLKNLPRSDINALGVDSNNQLYVAGSSTSTIYKLDVATGNLTPFATASANSAGDLVVVNGKLWLATAANTLESFDLATGAKTGSLYHGISNVFGLSITEDGRLYGFADTKAYVFDLGTGAATQVASFPIGQSVYGASQVASGWQSWYAGSSVSDTLSGTTCNDFVAGLEGNDTLNGLSGNDHLVGGGGNDSLDGGVGTDSATYAGACTNYLLTKNSSGWMLSGAADGTDTLVNIERLEFSDKKIALDLSADGHAGQALELIGLLAYGLVGASSVVGTVLSIFDQGSSMHDVCQLAINVGLVRDLAGSDSNLALAKLAFRNVVGGEASAETANWLAGFIQGSGGAMTQADFLATLAQLDLNQQHINLVGLQATGVEYL